MPDSKIIKPKLLKQGDKIGVISPASRPVDAEQFFKGTSFLEASGYSVVMGKSVLNERGYLAGTDFDRISDLNSMFADPAITAIICSRGGYGAPRILDKIDFETIRSHPKIFVGYSDITVLNLAIWTKTNLVTFSGPMVAVEMGKGIHEFSEKSLWENIADSSQIKKLKNPDDVEVKILNHGIAEGRLIVGCLSVLNGLVGTPYMPDLTDSILVIEDIEEEPYRIDRYFAQLKLTGILDKIRGLVLGQFIDCVPKDESKPSLSVEEVIADYISDLRIPIIANFAYGHGAIKLTLPVGVRARLDTSEKGITILESTVEA